MSSASAPNPLVGPSTRTELRALLALAWPLALANLLQMLVHAVDVIFVARLGERELAASSQHLSQTGFDLSNQPLDEYRVSLPTRHVRRMSQGCCFHLSAWLQCVQGPC